MNRLVLVLILLAVITAAGCAARLLRASRPAPEEVSRDR